MPAPNVYINSATSILNSIMPHPQQRNNEAKHVAEKRNPRKFVIILQQKISLLTCPGKGLEKAPINFRILTQQFDEFS
jgi:hypothetical protein